MPEGHRPAWATDLEVGFHLREDTELSPEGGAHQAAGRQGQAQNCQGPPLQALTPWTSPTPESPLMQIQKVLVSHQHFELLQVLEKFFV